MPLDPQILRGFLFPAPAACAPPSMSAIPSWRAATTVPGARPRGIGGPGARGSPSGWAWSWSWWCSIAPASPVDAVTAEQADIGFFAIDPVRGAGINFTDAYVLIEGAYPVRDAFAAAATAREVDRAGYPRHRWARAAPTTCT